MTEKDEERIRACAVALGSAFQDWMIVVRTREGGQLCLKSNETWALGASQKVAAAISDSDWVEHIKEMEQEDAEQ